MYRQKLGILSLVVSILLSWNPAVARTIDPMRSLIVTEREVIDLGGFTLERIFDQLVAQARVPGLTRLSLWRQWWETQAKAPPGQVMNAPHCDDEQLSDGTPAMNGFPIICPRAEAGEAKLNPFSDGNPRLYRVTALVNRFDLAPLNGKNCGEYRVTLARIGGSGRNLPILEGVLPNPRLRSGLQGCLPVVEFWAGLSGIQDPAARAKLLRDFYFIGLVKNGVRFAPVIHIDHYGRLGGQIRTNQFLESPWLLREFRLVQRKRALQFVPVTVKNNPFGELFNDLSVLRQAPKFRAAFVNAIKGLLPDSVMAIALKDDPRFNAGDSHSQRLEGDYAFEFESGGGSFDRAIRMALRGR